MPYWSIVTIDSIITGLSLLFFYVLLRGHEALLANLWQVLASVGVFLVCFLLGFRLKHTYQGVLRYSSFGDLSRISVACIVGCGLSMAASFVTSALLVPFPLLAILLGSFFAFAVLWILRVIVKLVYDTILAHGRKRQKVFIYGAREGGISLAKSIRAQDDSPYVLAGFVSDRDIMVGKKMMGVDIYANDEHLPETMRRNGASILLVSPLKNNEIRERSQMIDGLINSGIHIHKLPAPQEWDGKSEIGYSQLREVNVEDLLPRDKIEVDMEAIGNLLKGRRILITGAAGSIGSEMVRQIARFGPAELVLVDQAETPLHDVRLMMARDWPDISAHTIMGDIANSRRMEEIFNRYEPEYVFHAAAYKHVPMMEDNPSESIENNVNGTKIIADLAVRYGTRKFVMVSTDKAVNPTNVMGCSKRICEIYVQSLDKAIKEGKVKGSTCFVTTRFGNVLGSNGSVIPIFERQIKAGGPVTVTHPDIIRYFMLIPEACKLVLEAGTMGNGGEIFVFDMGKPVRIADLAKRMIVMSGAKDVEIKYTGLRDGEKLFEEVLNDEETTLPTFHKQIKIAKVREYDYNEVNRRITSLINLATTADDMTIVGTMKAIVPEFKSQHSKYEQLDGEVDKINLHKSTLTTNFASAMERCSSG